MKLETIEDVLDVAIEAEVRAATSYASLAERTGRDDLRALLKIESGDKRLAGVIVGREVTSGRFSLEDARSLMAGAAKDLGPWSLDQLESAVAIYTDVLGNRGDRDVAMTRDHLANFLRWLSGGTP